MAQNIDRTTLEEFQQYALRDVLVTENELGRGSYAVVLEIRYRGLKCAGKRLYRVLYETGIGFAARRYLEECRLLSQTRHPNIVQFIGVHFEEGSQFPILVMEFLPTNVTSCLERYGILSDEISYSILNDVTLGLAYLHGQTPTIIHRDLSGNNVLLSTSMAAKISDLGVAKILNITPRQRMTETPGTQAYMPPEVMVHDPQYGVSVDEFSFGVLMVHVFTAEWPAPKLPQTRVDPANPHNVIGITEVERREYFLRQVGQDHTLMDLITRCLSNNPILRPHAPELVGRMSDLVLRFPASFENRVEMLRRISADGADKRRLEQEVERKTTELEEKERELDDTRQEVATVRQEKERQQQEQRDEMERLTLTHSVQAERLQLQVADKESTVNKLENDISSVNSLLSSTRNALEQKEVIVEGLNRQLARTTDFLTSNPQPLQITLSCSQYLDSPIAGALGHSVLIGDDLYYGGIWNMNTNTEELCLISCYSTSRRQWSTLPQHPYRAFGLGQVNGKLVTVGGNFKACNAMYQYDAGRWNDMGTRMPTARSHPTVLSHPSCLIVAGGNTGHGQIQITRNVDIYNISTSQWREVASLPGPSVGLSGGIHKDNVYLIGGRDDANTLSRTFVAPIDLLRESQPHSLAWREITNAPAYWPATLVSRRMILTVGGYRSSDTTEVQQVKGVYGYSLLRNSWIHIGDLPVPVALATVAALSPTEFLVIGGQDANGQWLQTVYKCTIHTIYF